ncbi:hypothetical protein Metev_1290 [Methanohalobium evestigatum Z-7303]|uniref:Uncharacterized protein n=1 Tax=Methanohalobium evestigatum (strain ATCC BAA-1072 / DSM 3721 / NBRC 107634 / OCM 161 / Z-7303) TaxID=644295 RepID=D7E7T0_METEZ|nr:hypothetical protein [Methanohalobium evestigatum]ADI74153.1 hypothetical protein Metev_1290 [Methanohalobium evestigatum Z-7303]
MSLKGEKRVNKQLIVSLGIILIISMLTIFTIYYAENREVNDAKTLTSRILSASNDVKSYQFDIHSNISMMGETYTLVRGNGTVDYLNEKMDVKLKSMEDSIDLIIVDDTAYFKNGENLWDTKNLNQEIWDGYDQLTSMNLLLEKSTVLNMNKTDTYFVLTALPDTNMLLQEAEKTGLQLNGDEQLTEYSIRYIIEKDSYHINSIKSHIEFRMNVQGLMTPVIINNRVDIYNYDMQKKIEAPIIV